MTLRQEDQEIRWSEDPPAASPPMSDAAPRTWSRRLLPPLGCLVVYLLLATLLYRGSPWLSTTRITGCACGDQVQNVWFLAWPPYALQHGHNLFYSAWINYPAGMNLSVNTSMPLLGLLGAPITLLIGPVATYNFFLHLGVALSAFSLCLVLRRWTTWWPASFFGGLAYGFSAYMLGQGIGHLNLVFVPIPPLLLLILHDIVVRRRRPAWQSGGALGILATAQFFISPEVLLSTIIAGGIAVAFTAVARYREIGAAFWYVVRALAWAGGIAVVFLAYPAWVGLDGPQHVIGPPNPLADLALYPGDLLGTVAPTALMRVAPDRLIAVGSSLTGGSLPENGMYLGVPLLLCFFGFLIAFRRRPIILLAGAVALSTWVISLGAHLTVDRHATGIPLPFALLLHLPVLQDMLPVRFSLLTALFSAAVFALGLDMIRRRIGDRIPSRARAAHGAAHRRPVRSTWLGSAVALVIACVVALSLLPRSSYSSAATDVPAFFSSDSVQRIPVGTTVLTYPYPASPQLQGMLDQAVADMRFKITGGYGFVPDATGHSIFGPPLLPPPEVQLLFYSALHGGTYAATYLPPLATAVPAIRTYLTTYNVSTVIFYDVGAEPALVLRYMDAAIGPPTTDHGTTGWFGVAARLKAVAASTHP